jgi:hypothetical protein
MTFINWIQRVIQSEAPDAATIAYNFGLFQGTSGYSVYLIGSKEFDAEDSDWATNNDFEPKEKYYHFPVKEYNQLTWQQVLANVELSLRRFMDTDTFKNSFLAQAEAITIGFDDGDLIRLR